MSRARWTRRTFLGSAAATVALRALPARAQSSGRRFIFVNAEGGWDVLAALAPLHGDGEIQMEPGTEPLSVGGHTLTDGPGREGVRTFFEAHGAETAVLHGVSVRSVNHETCAAVALTGSTSDQKPDWATLLATEALDTTLPHVVFSGPSFAGRYRVLTARAEGRLQSLIDGNLLHEALPFSEPLPPAAGRVVDRFLSRRANALGASAPDDVNTMKG